jgi:hypothetical protein
MPRTDRLRLVNAVLGQFITGFAGRSFVVALPTIANTLRRRAPPARRRLTSAAGGAIVVPGGGQGWRWRKGV